MPGISKYNKSGCLDLTAYHALINISKAGRKAKGKKKPSNNQPPQLPLAPRPLVYIASPYRGDIVINTRNAIRFCRYASERGRFPIAPHIWLPQFLDDDNKSERKLALKSGLWLLGLCSEVWVFGNTATQGMQSEIIAARRLGIKIRYFGESTTGIYETRRPPE